MQKTTNVILYYVQAENECQHNTILVAHNVIYVTSLKMNRSCQGVFVLNDNRINKKLPIEQCLTHSVMVVATTNHTGPLSHT